ncbi:unnamed protein product [Cyprideis torosa]|uniref:Uncharacterized protein n=1 Tax=Cyprideis torosa TaxID=163714 RepID=A0A7R8ZNV3_9CRUS|nr:unnamed protein product [Cyprideis torosa]CAG0898917.1 unnamed protein product [Cyprideis torosa]
MAVSAYNTLDEFRAYWLEGQRVFNTVNAMFQSESMKWRLQKFKAKTPGLKFYYFNSKQYRRRIFMTEALFPISPLGLSNVFWEEGKDMPEWNPNVLKAGNLMDIGTKARATYQISKGAGAISSREFLNVNFKDKVANGTGFLVAYASIPSFPGYTPSKDYVT